MKSKCISSLGEGLSFFLIICVYCLTRWVHDWGLQVLPQYKIILDVAFCRALVTASKFIRTTKADACDAGPWMKFNRYGGRRRWWDADNPPTTKQALWWGLGNGLAVPDCIRRFSALGAFGNDALSLWVKCELARSLDVSWFILNFSLFLNSKDAAPMIPLALVSLYVTFYLSHSIYH